MKINPTHISEAENLFYSQMVTLKKIVYGIKSVFIFRRLSLVFVKVPSVGSCHHGMARPLGCGWGIRPSDMEVSCEYIE